MAMLCPASQPPFTLADPQTDEACRGAFPEPPIYDWGPIRSRLCIFTATAPISAKSSKDTYDVCVCVGGGGGGEVAPRHSFFLFFYYFIHCFAHKMHKKHTHKKSRSSHLANPSSCSVGQNSKSTRDSSHLRS